MDKRYQVFVSSTFEDLKTERDSVFTTLMEMDCIPAGMELFPAADEEQWNFIRRVIDDCDYYILIIGGRYGSLSEEGISYTEMEYDYAISLGLNVLAFVHGAPGAIPVEKSDIDPQLREKLNAFRARVCDGRLVKFWENASELPGLVSLSLNKTIRAFPAVGWVRANIVAGNDALVDLNQLRKENAELKSIIEEQKENAPNNTNINLASLDDYFEVGIKWKDYDNFHNRYDKIDKKINLPWGEIFACVAPDIQQHPSDGSANSLLGAALYRKMYPGKSHSADVAHDDFQTIRLQFQALKLIDVAYTKTTTGNMALFWTLTGHGEDVMIQLRSVKATPQATPENE